MAAGNAFRYRMLGDDGKVVRGMVELPFDDTTPAMRYLERQGGVVLSIAKVNPVTTAVMRFRTNVFYKVKRTDVAEICNNLSMLLTAGVPVLTALRDILTDLKNERLALALKFICTDIESGNTFSEAIKRHPKIFSPLIQSMCRIGEETGQLDIMLKKSAEHLIHLDQIIGATKRALMYPGFLAFVVIGASAFWFVVVVPQLMDLFTNMGVELPFLTLLVIAISDFLTAWGGYILLAGVAGVMVFSFLRKKSTQFRYYADHLNLRLPVISVIIDTSMVARISEYLGILQAAGVGIMRTLEIISEAVSNEVYKRRIYQVRESIRAGQSLSDGLRSAKAMHPFAVRMVNVGEQTGRIEEQTEYVATVYRERLSALVEVLGKSLEPAMLVFLGLIFAMVIGGLLLPVYDLLSQIA